MFFLAIKNTIMHLVCTPFSFFCLDSVQIFMLFCLNCVLFYCFYSFVCIVFQAGSFLLASFICFKPFSVIIHLITEIMHLTFQPEEQESEELKLEKFQVLWLQLEVHYRFVSTTERTNQKFCQQNVWEWISKRYQTQKLIVIIYFYL